MECFVMISYFNNHWDNIPNSETYYPKNYIHSKDLLEKLKDTKFYEKITTYFVKVSEWKIEHVYEGHISDVREKDDKIFFKVHLERKINKDEYNSHLFFVDILRPRLRSGECPYVGWYYQKYSILPSFFKLLKETKDPDEFEDLTYYLLKLIGINNIYKYPRPKQAGFADGIFKIGSLVVLYDATLKELEKLKEEKRQQISNYINQLRGDKISPRQEIDWEIKGFSKQVWIITRHNTGKREPLKIQDDIKVKVISIDDLFKIYEERLIGIKDYSEKQLQEINDEETLKKKLEEL